MKNKKIYKIGDIGPDAIARQQDRKIFVKAGIKRARARKISPLQEMFNRGIINHDQLRAGNIIARFFVTGVLAQFPKITSSYEPVLKNNCRKEHITDYQYRNIHNYHDALTSLSKK